MMIGTSGLTAFALGSSSKAAHPEMMLMSERIRTSDPSAALSHAADMIEHGRAVARQMLAVPDGAPLGPAEQLGEPSLSLNQRQIAQVVAVMLDQVEGVQHRLLTPASAPQLVEVRRPIVVGNRVFVTCWSDGGGMKRHLVCADREKGTLLWSKTVASTGSIGRGRGGISDGRAGRGDVAGGARGHGGDGVGRQRLQKIRIHGAPPIE